MHVAVLVKQVPQVDALELGGDGRLRRDAVALEMNPYCRRAVSQGVLKSAGSRRSVCASTSEARFCPRCSSSTQNLWLFVGYTAVSCSAADHSRKAALSLGRTQSATDPKP